MAKLYFIFLFSAFFLLGCEKSDLNPNYPTVIHKLSARTLAQMKTSFFQKNKYLITSLNEFGFCDNFRNSGTAESPPLSTILTQSEAIAIIKNFVSQNAAFTGVNNPNKLTFTQISSSSGYYDGATFWNIRSSFQKINSLDVLSTQIRFLIKNREIIYCIGNWYPNVYLPKKINISQDKAKSVLLNKVVTHTGIAGQKWYVTISVADLNKSTIKLLVIPITTDDRIELHIAWQVNIPGPVHYKIYVDVMTGKILSEQPTIIS